MNENDPMIETLHAWEAALGPKAANRLEINKVKRILGRTSQFLDECEECRAYDIELRQSVVLLQSLPEFGFTSAEVKQYRKQLQHISSHLQKVHKLLPEGYYLAVYMSLGMSIGLVFGLTLLDNLAMGLPIGMCIGLALGAGLDADAKKKGKTI